VQPEIFFKGIESAFGIDVPMESAKEGTSRPTLLQLWALKLKQAEEDLQDIKGKFKIGLVPTGEVRRAENAVESARVQLAAKQEELQNSRAQAVALPSRETQQQIFRELFAQLGVRLEPPKTAFFNELTGIMMVRVNVWEMEAVRAAVETLGGTPTAKLQAATGKAP